MEACRNHPGGVSHSLLMNSTYPPAVGPLKYALVHLLFAETHIVNLEFNSSLQ